MKKFLFGSLALGIILVLSLIAYGAYLNKAGEQQISERIAEQRIPVRVAKVERRNITADLLFPAIKLYSNNMTDVVSKANGRIQNMFVKKNDFVQEGQLICTVVDDEMPMKVRQAETNIKDAEGQMKAAFNNLDRQRRLWDKDATSLASLEEAEMKYNTTVAKFDDAIAKRDQLLVQQSYQDIIAPISGKVLTEYKTVGATVNSGTPIVMIGDFNELFCAVAVMDKVARNLYEDSTATFTFQKEDSAQFYDSSESDRGMFITGDSFTESAKIVEITPPLSEASNTRRIVWKFENRTKMLEPALYGDVIVKTSRSHSHLVIPTEALMDLKPPLVFVFDSKDNTIHLREIAIGVRDKDWVEVTSGLSEGELVVTSVTNDLQDGSQVVVKEVK